MIILEETEKEIIRQESKTVNDITARNYLENNLEEGYQKDVLEGLKNHLEDTNDGSDELLDLLFELL